MISPEHKKLLEQAKNNQFGVALRAFLDDKFAEINDITTIPNDSNMAVETRARQFALQVLKDLFYFMEEKKIVDKPKNQYQ